MEIPTELLHDILLKLPTKDVVRSGCVSRLWRSIVTDPSFHKLHAATPLHRDVGALLVSQHPEEHGGRAAESTVFRVVSSSGKPMCSVTVPTGHRLANVCNGLLCFASPTDGEAAAIICNPVSGEKLDLPKAPPLEGPVDRSWRRHHFALGFSPSTREYKLFRLSSSSTTNEDSHVHVYTLCEDDSPGWRQHPHVVQHCPMYDPPPVLVDGKLCMVTNKRDRILVMDVASETCRTFRLPSYRDREGLPTVNVRVNAFELHGRLSVAVNILDWDQPELQVWLLPPWDRLQTTKDANDDDDDDLYWDRRYSFRLDAPSSPAGCDLFRGRICSDNLQRAAWLDGDETLCYRLGDRLYRYDRRRYMPASNFGFLPWNQEPPLWEPPSATSSNFYGGYRPTLLSPHVFALTAPSSQVEQGNNQQEVEENTTVLLEPQCHKSKRHGSPVDRRDGRATKRICCSIIDRPCRCYLARLYKLYY